MLYKTELLERNNYNIIKSLSVYELPEKIKNIFIRKTYVQGDDEEIVLMLYKNKETNDTIYVSSSMMELYLDTLDGEPYGSLTKHETFKDYVCIETGGHYMYEHKDNIDTLMKLDIINKTNDKYLTYSYGWVDPNAYYWDEDFHYNEEE